MLQNERFERFLNGLSKENRSKTAQDLNGFERFIEKNRSKTAQDLIIKSRPQRDSNPQSSDSKSDALSVRP